MPVPEISCTYPPRGPTLPRKAVAPAVRIGEEPLAARRPKDPSRIRDPGGTSPTSRSRADRVLTDSRAPSSNGACAYPYRALLRAVCSISRPGYQRASYGGGQRVALALEHVGEASRPRLRLFVMSRVIASSRPRRTLFAVGRLLRRSAVPRAGSADSADKARLAFLSRSARA